MSVTNIKDALSRKCCSTPMRGEHAVWCPNHPTNKGFKPKIGFKNVRSEPVI